MIICIDYDQHLKLPLDEEEMEFLSDMGIKHNSTTIPAQKIDLESDSMESLLDIIEDHTRAYVSLHRYDLGRYSLTLEGRFL